jgi:hypothetical protein
MAGKRFIGARLDEELSDVVDEVARGERIDRTAALKRLIAAGWSRYRLEKALDAYRCSRASIDRAAEMAGLTVAEMMQEAAARGVGSDEGLAEYRAGLRLLAEGER